VNWNVSVLEAACSELVGKILVTVILVLTSVTTQDLVLLSAS
jgi:hypothetical protein